MANHDSTTNRLRHVSSEQVITHKAALNPLIKHYELSDTISQINSILAFIQSLTLIADDEKGLQLQNDAVTGLYYVLQVVIETLSYAYQCECLHDKKPTYLIDQNTDNV